ncbi:unnamed protein product [Orchesella dallaii]|uniref:Uncharacterized protein n=1 Tax=Orchesella dallaii TaxID=48710 RepID=A0ABP1R5G8_9HEXA
MSDMAEKILKKLLMQTSDGKKALTPAVKIPFFSKDVQPALLSPQSSPTSPNDKRSSQPKPTQKRFRRNPSCTHSKIVQYLEPCLECSIFCNCRHLYSPAPPNVLVRSLDRKIVRLSGWLVRASETLTELMTNALTNKAGGGAKLEEQRVIITTDVNDISSVIKYELVSEGSNNLGSDANRDASYSSSSDETSASASSEHEQSEETSELKDFIQWDDSVLILFDTETEIPTLGVMRDILVKLDYFVCMHLDEVDKRITCQQRSMEYFAANGHVEPLDAGMLHSFVYEDWEEDFFNVDHGTFYDLIQANEELLIWDLYFAITKWTVLFRGFPLRMENGLYDLIDDPEYMNHDRKNYFGLYNTTYRIPVPKPSRSTRVCYRKCLREFCFNVTDVKYPGFIAKWWVLVK